ncbi:MAG TPA: hypothetical protein VLF88_03880 [Candidatus Babeliales bacterium]|nr:hypothetical protein [Candidatus Babeliales bacterium]
MSKSVKKSAKRTKNIRSDNFSKYILIVFVLVFAAVGGYILLHSQAATPPATPSVYLTPDSSTLNAGDKFTVNVYENSGTDTVNVADLYLKYPTNLVSYVSYTNSASFPLVAVDPSGDNGSVHFVRGICGGCSPQTGAQLVISVTFKGLVGGSAPINFDTGTRIVRSTDNLPEPNLNQAGGTYTIQGTTSTTAPPPPATGGTTTKPKAATVTNATPKTASPAPVATTRVPQPSTPAASSQEPVVPVVTPTQTTSTFRLSAGYRKILQVGAGALGVAIAAGLFLEIIKIRAAKRHEQKLDIPYTTFPSAPKTPVAPPIQPGASIPAQPTPTTAIYSEKIIKPISRSNGSLTPNLPKKA